MIDFEAIKTMTEEELNALLEAVKAQLAANEQPAENGEPVEGEEKPAEMTEETIAMLEKAVEAIGERRAAIKIEKRAAKLEKALREDAHVVRTFNENKGDVKTMNEFETRANNLKETGRMELRALLSTGTIAKPTKADGINEMANELGSIVDDVKSVQLTGNGAYVVAYQKTRTAAADITDGSAVAGTMGTFDTVTINPKSWGIVGQISNLVKKVSPLEYAAALERDAIYALRAKAEAVIYAAISASSLAETKTYALDANYMRNLFLGYKSIAGKGGVKLYLCRADLTTLSQVRGTNEKKPLYEIKFDNGSTTTGVISEGGFAAPFSITESLTTGTQLFGQPATVEMPMWDGYTIETDESRYFEYNQTAYRGIQTANADLCAYHGMQVVSNS